MWPYREATAVTRTCTAAFVECDIDCKRECERYKFDSGVLHVDPGDGHLQKIPAHITHGHVAQRRACGRALTMEDQEQDQLFEGIGEVGTGWCYGNGLVREGELQHTFIVPYLRTHHLLFLATK